jgi:small subunit ribosomal protein S14
MSQFRAAKLDIGCFAKIRNIRDHTKRKVYMENEPERYAPALLHTRTSANYGRV